MENHSNQMSVTHRSVLMSTSRGESLARLLLRSALWEAHQRRSSGRALPTQTARTPGVPSSSMSLPAEDKPAGTGGAGQHQGDLSLPIEHSVHVSLVVTTNQKQKRAPAEAAGRTAVAEDEGVAGERLPRPQLHVVLVARGGRGAGDVLRRSRSRKELRFARVSIWSRSLAAPQGKAGRAA